MKRSGGLRGRSRKPVWAAALVALVVTACAIIITCLAITGDSPALDGLCFSPYLGEDTVKAWPVDVLVETVAPFTGGIRTFASRHEWADIARLARRHGLFVAAGAGIGEDAGLNTLQIEGLIELAGTGDVDLAVVGDEILMWDILPEEELIQYIEEVKSAGLPAATSDSWDEFLSRPKLVEAVDVVIINVFPFWEGVRVDDAVDFIDEAYESVKSVSGGKEVVVETGWPSGGEANGEAVPGPVNAARFLNDFTAWARSRGVRYFYFEAFDEPWKLEIEGSVGPHWGLWDRNVVMKPYARPIL